ncbi:MAG: glycosyltransferase family 4 protein [Terriglobia bacterium]|jgi:glycosyltransferase involved in cell wall biosynthesis
MKSSLGITACSRRASTRMRILILNEYFYPDVASTAQHSTDLAQALERQGHEITVVSGRRGYEGGGQSLPGRETWEGIRICRVSSLGLAKTARWQRAAHFASFLLAAAWRLLWLGSFDAVVAMTTPPLISALAAAFVWLRGGRLIVWVMDLNPDEALAAGWLREGSLATRFLENVMGGSLRRADAVAVLDRFMSERLVNKGVPERKLEVIPPWAHNGAVHYDPEGRKAFRERHGLDGKFVVMYAGNHSPCHPLDTLLQAAERLAENTQIAFCFVGGGSEFIKVKGFAKANGLRNIVCLPYQPLGSLSGALSAADLHVAVMGNPFVGIVHPCKIYNIINLGIPFLYIGPPRSHVVDLLPPGAAGTWAYIAGHGEVDKVVEAILAAGKCCGVRFEEEAQMGVRFAQEELIPRMTGLVTGAPACQATNRPLGVREEVVE